MTTETPPVHAPSSSIIFSMPLDIRWRDLDAFDHVNNSNFLTYLEEARIRYFAAHNTDWVTDEHAPLLAAAHINYKMPIPYTDKAVVDLSVDKIGNSSVTIGHRIYNKQSDVLYADGYCVVVWIDRRSGKAIALPEAVKEIIATPLNN